MKQLTLLSLHMENFQKFRDFSVSFNPESTTISGENASGKTTIMSAFHWCLYGKDANGLSDTGRGAFDIKTRTADGVAHKTDVSVTALIDISGTQYTVRRTLHEKWTKNDDYTGDETLLFVNEVPYQVGEFSKWIEENIADEDTFRLISRLGYFLTLKDQQKRALLFTMAGVKSLEDICSTNKEWRALYADLTGKSLEDYVKQLKYEQKALTKDLDAISPQITLLEKNTPVAQDWSALEQKRDELTAKIDSLQAEINSASSFSQSQQAEKDDIQHQLSQLQSNGFRLTSSLLKAKEDAISAKRAEVRKLNEHREDTMSKINKTSRLILDLQSQLRQAEAEKEEILLKINTAADEVRAIMGETFSSEVKCPLSGHICTDTHVCDLAESDYNTRKVERLAKAKSAGKQLISQRDDILCRIEDINLQISTQVATLESLESLRDSLPPVVEFNPDSVEVPEREDINAQIVENNRLSNELRSQLAALESQSVTPDRTAQRITLSETRVLRDRIVAQLTERDIIARNKEQIQALNDKADELSDAILLREQQISTARDIDHAIAEDATERINNLFELTDWQLFEQQKNGLMAEVCKPTLLGVSRSLNLASRININIDICNAVSRFYDLSVPLFIDNSESVNNILPHYGQTVRLAVAPSGSPLSIS